MKTTLDRKDLYSAVLIGIAIGIIITSMGFNHGINRANRAAKSSLVITNKTNFPINTNIGGVSPEEWLMLNSLQ